MDWTQIALALITVTGVIAGAYYKFRSRQIEVDLEKELTHEEREARLASSGKDFVAYLKAWSDVERDVEALLTETCLDRFVMLRAWNGIRDPELTTAIYQYKQGSDHYQSYEHVELDADYRGKLRRTYDGPVIFNVSQQPPSLIKSIYDSEGVKAAAWYYVLSGDINGVKERSTTYCSFCSSTNEQITDATLLRAQLVVSKIKGIMYRFQES